MFATLRSILLSWLDATWPLALAAFVFATAAGTPVSTRDHRPARLAREEAIAALLTLGRIEVDERQPSRPVVKVSLTGRRVDDETLGLLRDMTEVRELTLRDTRVTDAGILRLRHLTKLRRLSLDGVDITDDGLAGLAAFRELEWLALLDTRIDGRGLGRLEPLDRLRCLCIEAPLVTVEGLRRLRGLTALALWKTRLTDRGLGPLKGLPDIKELILDDETPTFQGLSVLQALPRLGKLSPGGVRGSDVDLDRFRSANPRIQIVGAACGTPRSSREAELELRRLHRQGLIGWLRLAWRSFVESVCWWA